MRPSRVILLLAAVAISLACGGGTTLTKGEAVASAKKFVVRTAYRGDRALFYRNTGNRPTAVRKLSRSTEGAAWFVRFDDFQAMNKHCVRVYRLPHQRSIAVRSVHCY